MGTLPMDSPEGLMMKLSIIVALLVTLTACPRSPSPPIPDASDAAASNCAVACANLAALGCREGIDANCAATCQRSKALTDIKPDCLAAAITKESARACGSVTCP